MVELDANAFQYRFCFYVFVCGGGDGDDSSGDGEMRVRCLVVLHVFSHLTIHGFKSVVRRPFSKQYQTYIIV